MFWNDISEIKECLTVLVDRFMEMDYRIKGISQDLTDVQESQSDSLCRLHDKLNAFMDASELLKQVELSQKTLDKFEDYMKNVDKLNSMINEFKGCISMSRAAIAERKQLQNEFDELINIGKISKEIYKSMQSFINAGSELEHKNYFKLDAIYRKVCDIEEEKPKKKGNSRKKKASTPSS